MLALEGLRPTPDRVRETLFNWLQGDLYQARCLDLFAGSGALGFEAISRGAAQLVMVEKHRAAAQQLVDNIRLLKSNNIILEQDDAYHYLDSSRERFDLIFLDPPFHKGHIVKLIQKIMATQRLAPKGLIYLEYEAEISIDMAQWNLRILKHTQAGQSQAFLLTQDISGVNESI